MLAWSCNDKIVGHDSFSTLTRHIPSDRVLYRERLGHVPWVSKLHEATTEQGDEAIYGEAVYLTSALVRVLADVREPRGALAAYVEFGEGCG